MRGMVSPSCNPSELPQRVREGTREEMAPAECEDRAVEQARALHLGLERHAGTAAARLDRPEDGADRAPADLRAAAQLPRLDGADHARARDPRETERSAHAHGPARAVAVERLELCEALRQAPVVAQVGEEREDALGRLVELCGGADQAVETTTSEAKRMRAGRCGPRASRFER